MAPIISPIPLSTRDIDSIDDDSVIDVEEANKEQGSSEPSDITDFNVSQTGKTAAAPTFITELESGRNSNVASTTKKSWVWKHFKKTPAISACKVFCLLCEKDVSYTVTHSTRMLERHIKRCHAQFDHEALQTGEKKTVETYQHLQCVEDKSFHQMCYSLNKILSRDKLQTLLQFQYVG